MNEYDDNPFIFFMDNQPYPIEIYTDIGKIIELSDTGCDARAPLTSARRRNDQNRPYSAKTLHPDVLSFQEVFDEQEKHRDRQFNETRDKKAYKVPARDRTVPRNPRSRTRTELDNNEKVEQWERNVADFPNILLRDQANFMDDSSIENIADCDKISENSRTYFWNSKNSLSRTEINRKSRKEKTNVKNEIRESIPDFAKNSNESRSTPGFSREETSKGKRIASATRSTRVDRKKRREDFEKNNNTKINGESKDFIKEKRRSVDRAVDKDSLSDNSDMSDDDETNTNENYENLPKEEKLSLGQRSKALPDKSIKNREILQKKKTNSSLEKRSKILSNESIGMNKVNSPERKDINASRPSQETTKSRVKSQTRSISKSADFDKAKHRANMAKRYANKAWMKSRQNTFTNAKTEVNETSDNSNTQNIDQIQRNDVSRTKAVSKSAGAPTRKREDAQTETTKSKEANMVFPSDDNADPSRRTMKTVEEPSSTSRTRTTGVAAPKSFRQEEENNSTSTTQGSIQRKDLEKLSALFLSSTLKRNVKSSFSKANERESRKERNKSVPTNRNRMEGTRLDRISSSRIANEGTSKIRPSVSNLSKLPSKTEKWVKSKIPVAISRLKKELEHRDYSESPSRGSSSGMKSTMRDSYNERIDESTSIGIISIDKSDYTKNENNEKTEIRSRLDEWSKKLEETRRKERDVEMKVLKMAKAQKEERKKEFEKRGFRESVKKSRNEGKKDIVDIAAMMFEREPIEKKTHCTTNYNDNTRDIIDGDCLENGYTVRKESYTKPYSLRNSMYTRYFPTAL